VIAAPMGSMWGAGVRGWQRWLAPLAVLLGILFATSMPAPPPMPHGRDKVVHLLAYALLGASVAWAAESRAWRRAVTLIVLVSAIGAADEFHQHFIPNRAMDVRDWLADTAGAVTGVLLMTAQFRRRESAA
jgi:VanZ family protein